MEIRFLKESSVKVTGVPFTLIVNPTFPRFIKSCLQSISPFNNSGRSPINIGFIELSDKCQLKIIFLIAVVAISESFANKVSNIERDILSPVLPSFCTVNLE